MTMDCPKCGSPVCTHVEREKGLSLKATFADAVLESKRLLDEAVKDLEVQCPKHLYKELDNEEMAALVQAKAHLAQGYARLAQALQHGAPGERF